MRAVRFVERKLALVRDSKIPFQVRALTSSLLNFLKLDKVFHCSLSQARKQKDIKILYCMDSNTSLEDLYELAREVRVCVVSQKLLRGIVSLPVKSLDYTSNFSRALKVKLESLESSQGLSGEDLIQAYEVYRSYRTLRDFGVLSPNIHPEEIAYFSQLSDGLSSILRYGFEPKIFTRWLRRERLE